MGRKIKKQWFLVRTAYSDERGVLVFARTPEDAVVGGARSLDSAYLKDNKKRFVYRVDALCDLGEYDLRGVKRVSD